MTDTTNTPRILSSSLFGEFSRYKLIAFATRFGGVEYHVSDAMVEDEATGLPSIIRQSADIHEALHGLSDEPRAEAAIAAVFQG